MPINVTIYKARRRKTDSRGRRPSKARDEALQAQMEASFKAEYATGIRRVKGGVSTQKMADAYYDKDYAGVMIDVPFEDFNKYLAEAIGELGKATAAGGAKAAAVLDDLDGLRYDLDNPRIRDYLETRTGALIDGVTDDFQVTVQDLIKTRFAQGTNTQELAIRIGDQLRASIGLDRVSAGALARANASGKYTARELAAYEDRLLERRAENIARTEVAYANNEGQMAVWEAAADQGLIEDGAQKVWVAEATPCDICKPMDGIAVDLSDDFLLPDGVTVSCPPAHPRCRCLMQLLQSESGEVPGSNAQNYKRDDD